MLDAKLLFSSPFSPSFTSHGALLVLELPQRDSLLLARTHSLPADPLRRHLQVNLTCPKPVKLIPFVSCLIWFEVCFCVCVRVNVSARERHQQQVTKSCHLIPPGAPSSLLSSTSANSSQQVFTLAFRGSVRVSRSCFSRSTLAANFALPYWSYWNLPPARKYQ